MQFYVISSDFHGVAILSRHRTIEAAQRNCERVAARHGKECSCAGPRVIWSNDGLRIGYRLGCRRIAAGAQS